MNCQIRCGQTVVAEKAKVAKTFKDRLIGLMFSHDLGDKDCLIVEPTTSIHTCFMSYPIDVIFLNNKNVVIKIIPGMKPWRMTRIYLRARRVLEMKAGTFPINEISCGDQLEIKCLS